MDEWKYKDKFEVQEKRQKKCVGKAKWFGDDLCCSDEKESKNERRETLG